MSEGTVMKEEQLKELFAKIVLAKQEGTIDNFTIVSSHNLLQVIEFMIDSPIAEDIVLNPRAFIENKLF